MTDHILRLNLVNKIWYRSVAVNKKVISLRKMQTVKNLVLIIFSQLLKLSMLFLNCVFSSSPTVQQSRYKSLLVTSLNLVFSLYCTCKLELKLPTPLL